VDNNPEGIARSFHREMATPYETKKKANCQAASHAMA
jgi:hypothetical protein